MFHFSDLLDLAVVFSNYACVGLYVKLIVFEKEIVTPVQTEKEFQSWIDTASMISSVKLFCGFVVIIMSIRSVFIIATQFPIFASLFFTLSNALKDLLNIFVTMAILLVGYSFFLCLMYGSKYNKLSGFWSVYLSIFYIIVNPIDFSAIEEELYDPSIGSVFLQILAAIYIILIVLTLMKMLVSIIIIRYRYLRSTMQETSEAMALVLKEQSREYLQKWFNFFLCRKPVDTGEAIRTSSDAEVGLTLWVIMRMNINNILFGDIIKSKGEREEEIKKHINDIRRKKLDDRKERRKKYSPENLEHHKSRFKQMLLFLVYFFLGDIIIVMMQFNISEHIYSTYVENYLTSKTYILDLSEYNDYSSDFKENFDIDISTVLDTIQLNQWVEKTLIPIVYNYDKLSIFEQNNIFNKPYIRVSVIKIDYQNYNGREIDKSPVVSANLNVNYTEPGTDESPFQLGGFVLGYPDTQAEALSIRYLRNKEYLSINWFQCHLEFLFYNQNSDIVSISLTTFEKTPAGLIIANGQSFTTEEYYNSPTKKFRGFLEIIYIMLFCFYVYNTVKAILGKYQEVVIIYYQNKDRRKSISVANYLGIQIPDNWTTQTFILAAIVLIFVICKGSILMIVWMIKAVINYFRGGPFRFFKFISLIIGFQLISTWIEIGTEDSFEIQEDRLSPNAYRIVFNKISKMEYYKKLFSVHILINSMIILKYLSFSQKLSMFNEILTKAFKDILFLGLVF